LFKVIPEMMDQCRLTVMEQTEDILRNDFGLSPFEFPGGLNAYVHRRMMRPTNFQWIKHEVPFPGVQISSYQEDDGIPIRTYRSKFNVPETTENMLEFILTGRQYWDLDLIEWRKICEINENSDIIHYVSQSMSPHPHRDYCLFRSWEKFDDGKCHLFITSTRHEKVTISLV